MLIKNASEEGKNRTMPPDKSIPGSVKDWSGGAKGHLLGKTAQASQYRKYKATIPATCGASPAPRRFSVPPGALPS